MLSGVVCVSVATCVSITGPAGGFVLSVFGSSKNEIPCVELRLVLGSSSTELCRLLWTGGVGTSNGYMEFCNRLGLNESFCVTCPGYPCPSCMNSSVSVREGVDGMWSL